MGNAIFVVGLLKPLKKKFESYCKRVGLQYSAILADKGRKGDFILLPIGQDSKYALQSYVDKMNNNYEDCWVVVLPYAALSAGLGDELNTLEELGSKVIKAINGKDGWPQIQKRQRPDTSTLNAVYERLLRCLPAAQQISKTPVSDHFREVQEKNNRIHFHANVLCDCDAVAPYRHEFMRRAISALSDFIVSGSEGVRIDTFLKKRGIEHAQSGGINATLRVLCNGREIYKKTANTHLKKGDKTTPEGAVRIYYQVFNDDNDDSHIAIIYAGSHPKNDISWTLDIGYIAMHDGSAN